MEHEPALTTQQADSFIEGIEGVRTNFGLLNNIDRDIKGYIDEEIIGEERMSFHPNTNEKAIFIKTCTCAGSYKAKNIK